LGGAPVTGADLKQRAQETGQQLKQKAVEAGEQLKQKGVEATDQLREKGGEVFSRIKQQGQDLLGEQKEQVLGKISHCSAAARRAAEQLRNENDSNLAEYADAIAGQIDRTADYFRSRNVPDVMRDVEGVVRRQPELFLGAMFILGLGLARFLKASSHPIEPDGATQSAEPMQYTGAMAERPAAPGYGDQTQYATTDENKPYSY
jgi:gas vesicle protein